MEVWDQGASTAGLWWEPSSWLGGRPPSCCVLTWPFLSAWCEEGEHQSHHGGPTPKTSSQPNYLSRPPPDTITWWVRASTCDCGGDTHIQSTTTSRRASDQMWRWPLCHFPAAPPPQLSLAFEESKENKQGRGSLTFLPCAFCAAVTLLRVSLHGKIRNTKRLASWLPWIELWQLIRQGSYEACSWRLVREELGAAPASPASLGTQSAGLLTMLSDVDGIYEFSIAAIKWTSHHLQN